MLDLAGMVLLENATYLDVAFQELLLPVLQQLESALLGLSLSDLLKEDLIVLATLQFHHPLLHLQVAQLQLLPLLRDDLLFAHLHVPQLLFDCQLLVLVLQIVDEGDLMALHDLVPRAGHPFLYVLFVALQSHVVFVLQLLFLRLLLLLTSFAVLSLLQHVLLNELDFLFLCQLATFVGLAQSALEGLH